MNARYEKRDEKKTHSRKVRKHEALYLSSYLSSLLSAFSCASPGKVRKHEVLDRSPKGFN
jgi:hypothetical protein